MFPPLGEVRKGSLLHHSAHAAHAGVTHWHFGLVLLGVADDALGGEEHSGNAGCVLKSNAGYLGRVDDSAGLQSFVLVGTL